MKDIQKVQLDKADNPSSELSIGKAKEVSKEIKELIIKAVGNKMTYRQISELYNVSKPGISHTMKRFCLRKTIESKTCSGRPKVTTEKSDRLSVRYSKIILASLLSNLMQFHCTNCSVNTTKRQLRQNNLYGRCPVKISQIPARNLKTRTKFAKDHISWSVNDWSKVFFF
ncbi:uncharacterized protein LOC136091766 [Hydra vulgaris]|uniref:Uncharacterized protein LOC136091766 n=1 Tax=Hydra vulgaris TaxID=6087 RepID=A0ABM4DLY3_HYDVU